MAISDHIGQIGAQSKKALQSISEECSSNDASSSSSLHPQVELKGQAYLEATHGSQWRSVTYDLLMQYKNCLKLSGDDLGFHILTFIDSNLENALLRGSQKQRNQAAYDIFNSAVTMREKKRLSKVKDGKDAMMDLLRRIYGDS